MLAALGRATLGAPALPARRADQAARCARWPASTTCRSPPSPTRRTSASWPAPAASASWPATAGCASAPGDVVDPAARVLGRHRGHFHYTVGQRRGLGVHAARAALRAAPPTRAPTRSPSARATRCEVDRVALRGVRLHRDGRRSTACSCATAPRPCRAGWSGRRGRAREPFSAPAPGQTAVLLAGDVVVGCATIAA